MCVSFVCVKLKTYSKCKRKQSDSNSNPEGNPKEISIIVIVKSYWKKTKNKKKNHEKNRWILRQKNHKYIFAQNVCNNFLKLSSVQFLFRSKFQLVVSVICVYSYRYIGLYVSNHKPNGNNILSDKKDMKLRSFVINNIWVHAYIVYIYIHTTYIYRDEYIFLWNNPELNATWWPYELTVITEKHTHTHRDTRLVTYKLCMSQLSTLVSLKTKNTLD